MQILDDFLLSDSKKYTRYKIKGLNNRVRGSIV